MIILLEQLSFRHNKIEENQTPFDLKQNACISFEKNEIHVLCRK